MAVTISIQHKDGSETLTENVVGVRVDGDGRLCYWVEGTYVWMYDWMAFFTTDMDIEELEEYSRAMGYAGTVEDD